MLALHALLDTLERLAPLRLAAAWDNVGLLVAPPADRPLRAALLTIDLTEAVLNEAIGHGVDAIVAYHPPIFSGLRRLDDASPTARLVLRLARAGIAVYSPHTALDAVQGGMGDWLLGALGPCDEIRPITPAVGAGLPPGAGSGRLAVLRTPAPLAVLIPRIKAWLDLSALRVAAPEEHAAGQPLRTVAVCPGAGGALFAGLGPVDLLLTGELKHHDVLDRVACGSSVVITDHTHTERGFLSVLAERVRAELPMLTVIVSARDRDPLVLR